MKGHKNILIHLGIMVMIMDLVGTLILFITDDPGMMSGSLIMVMIIYVVGVNWRAIKRDYLLRIRKIRNYERKVSEGLEKSTTNI